MNFLNDIPQRVRLIWLGLFLCSTFSMGYALYAEHILELKPCNLCMLQRGSMVALGIIAFLAAIFHFKNKFLAYTLTGLASLAALSGIILAGRHVWLQHLPKDQVPACGPDFEFLMAQFPLSEVLTEIFQGSGDCAETQWQFLSFSMPEVLLGLFIGFFLTSLFQIWNISKF